MPSILKVKWLFNDICYLFSGCIFYRKSLETHHKLRYVKLYTYIFYLNHAINKNLLNVFSLDKKQPFRGVSRKVVRKICGKFTGEHPCRSVISIKLLCKFIEIALRHGCSPVNLLHIFRAPLLKKTPLDDCFCLIQLCCLTSIDGAGKRHGGVKLYKFTTRHIRISD